MAKHSSTVVICGAAESYINKGQETKPRSSTRVICVWVQILPKLLSQPSDWTCGGGKNDFKYMRCTINMHCRSPVPQKCGKIEHSANASAFLKLNLALLCPISAQTVCLAMSLSDGKWACNGEQ